MTNSPGWVDFDQWEALIKLKGVTIERTKHSEHPSYPDIIYPIDYGYVNGTFSSDGEEVDIFVGSGHNGLVAAIFTVDLRKKDRECKLIYNCSPEEVYLVNGFINFEPTLMHGRLLMRRPMMELYDDGTIPRVDSTQS